MQAVEETRRPILQMKKRRKNRQTKTVLLFDEDARKEYLTGFQKRKNQRRKQAKLENEKKVKDERIALKQKVREMMKKSDSHRLPEVEEFLRKSSTNYDLPEHTVTITDISDTPTASNEITSDDVQDLTQQKEDGKEEDPEILKKKKKKLIHQLAQVGNHPMSKKKAKRLGKFQNKGKFKGGQ